MDDTTRNDAFKQFSDRLPLDGVRGALSYLLTLTDYRFIAIFRFNGNRANAAVFYDRQNPSQLSVDEVPDTATYCCFIRDGKGAFMTADAAVDERLADHVAREVVRAYCGVPVMDAEGALLGTLCHYDLDPRDPQQVDTELMLQVASALALGGHVPPYPAAA